MSALLKLGAFGAALAALFGVGALAGGLTEPEARGGDEPAGDHGAMEQADTHGGDGGHAAAADADVHGLAVADGGLRLEVVRPELRRGRSETVAFRIVDADGAPVRDYEVTHEERMHLILVRRDLTGFQHLHPELGADGTWRTRTRIAEAGSYRLFADFKVGGEAVTLASDLRVDGPADLRELPAPADVDRTDGYEVRLDAGTPHAGEEAELNFTITRDGEPVKTEPYLGAGGHLVALREGDLAFLHVHPTTDVDFGATFPSAGRYRLFLQFKHEGRVRTVAFTQEVAR